MLSDFNTKPDISEGQAIFIAQEYVNKKYENEFNEYEIKAKSKEDVWIVTYSKNTKSDKNEALLGGGCPELHIKKSSGKVISCLLQ